MILKKITLENIRSYKYLEVEFPIGSTLLAGDIGSGKTSILLGIEFALFGLQPGQRGAALLRNGEIQAKVQIEFEVDSQSILVERTLKKAKTISQDYCAITINGEKKEISVTELKDKVLELLNYPREFSKKQNLLYKFTVYTPQEEMKQIILQDSKTRLNTLRHVFGIDKYKKILENISIITIKLREEKRIKQALTENFEHDKLYLIEKENDLESKYYNLDSVEKELFSKREIRKKIEEEKLEISKKIEEKNRLLQEIEKTKIIILNKKDLVLENRKKMIYLENQIKELEDLKIDESKILQLERIIDSDKKEKEKFIEDKLEINSKINSLKMKNEENEKLERKISNLEVCPTCLQNVDAIYRTNVLNQARSDIVSNNKKLEILEKEKEEIKMSIEKKDTWIYSKEKELTNLKISKIKYQGIEEKQNQFEESRKLSSMIEKDMELLETHNEILKDSVFELSRFDNVFKERERNLEEAFNEERDAEIKVAELKKEIDFFSKQIEELKLKLKQTQEIKKQADYITKLEDWLSKKFMPVVSFIEKNVMTKLKSEFSKLFAEWFSMLVSDFIQVRLDDEFTPIIEQQDYELEYNYLSGGERTAIALAYRLSLNQVINSLLSKIKTRDLVILDEPTEGFSEQQLDKMRDVLQQLDVAQLILVSHEQKIEGFVDNVLRFKKENGVSKKEE